MPNSFHDDNTYHEDIDAAVIQSLSLLTKGNPLDFVEFRSPPTGIRSWIRSTEMRDARGLLLAALRRWHQLRYEEEK